MKHLLLPCITTYFFWLPAQFILGATVLRLCGHAWQEGEFSQENALPDWSKRYNAFGIFEKVGQDRALWFVVLSLPACVP